jgi:hypothetical protein
MREELLELFRDTQRSPLATSITAAVKKPPAASDEPSKFLRRYLKHGAPAVEPAATGLGGLDAHLGGGFGPGLHLVLGLPGFGKTAFLESVAWESISSERPVIYYALKEGGLRVWERMIGTLAHVLNEPRIPAGALRAHTLTPDQLQVLNRLDVAFQAVVLPYLSLVDSVPAFGVGPSAIIEDLGLRVHEAIDQHGRIPLLLVDDLERLLVLTEARPLFHVLSRLDDALAADSVPGLLTATQQEFTSSNLEDLPVHSTFAFTSSTTSGVDGLTRVKVELLPGGKAADPATFGLFFDRRSGLFSQPVLP